jgi:hypothetical protein
MIGALMAHVSASQPAELRVDDRKELTGGVLIALGPLPQEPRYLLA